MVDVVALERNDDERWPESGREIPITDELNRILAMLQMASPEHARISFEFNGRLHVHIDVRNAEEVASVEAALPELGKRLFHSVRRGTTPHHPFLRRVSAQVAS